MKQSNDKSLNSAITARRESKRLDFKKKFDDNQAEDWCEIIKDIIAMANSGGGIIIIGVNDDGSPSNEDISAILRIDPAQITDKLARYTGEQFDNFSIQEAVRKEHKIAVLQINRISIPMVFIQPGTYDVGDGKQKTAFSKGSIYFRHGAKSEPGNSNDLRKSLERELERIKKSWLGNIRKVVDAPTGYKVKLLPPEVVESNLPDAMPIRIVNDPTAPGYKKIWDESPYHSPQEIVIGALKSWKRDKTSYASESDMWELYSSRNNISLDEEKAECLLESAINRHAPFFFWAKLLSSSTLKDFIKRIAIDGKYPSPNMVLKLAHAIGGKVGLELIDYVAKNCSYSSVKSTANTLKKTIESKDRLKKIYGTKVKIGARSIDVEKTKREDVEKLINDAIKARNKAEIKHIDALLYGPELEVKR